MTVFLVYRNSDTTEGRGPMILDSAWATRELAAEYIDGRPGIMGRRDKWSAKQHGDWYIEQQQIREDHAPYETLEQRRKIALAKLTTDELEALGLEAPHA